MEARYSLLEWIRKGWQPEVRQSRLLWTALPQILDLTLKNTTICPAAYEVGKRLREALPV